MKGLALPGRRSFGRGSRKTGAARRRRSHHRARSHRQDLPNSLASARHPTGQVSMTAKRASQRVRPARRFDRPQRRPGRHDRRRRLPRSGRPAILRATTPPAGRTRPSPDVPDARRTRFALVPDRVPSRADFRPSRVSAAVGSAGIAPARQARPARVLTEPDGGTGPSAAGGPHRKPHLRVGQTAAGTGLDRRPSPRRPPHRNR